jgi:hypothetical protein
MKLYYVKVPDDNAGTALIAEHRNVIGDIGGTISLSRSFGIGDATVVLTLPDSMPPSDVGLPEAEHVMDLEPDKEEPKEDGVELRTLGSGAGTNE